MSRTWLGVAGILGAAGVLLGAFGGHLLRPVLPLQRMTIFETAVRYHLLHTLALMGTALAMTAFPAHARSLNRVAAAFAAGIVIFSGSLYLLVLLDQPWLGALTPVGGLLWIAGWVCLAITGLRQPKV